jgi:hypothetical protein
MVEGHGIGNPVRPDGCFSDNGGGAQHRWWLAVGRRRCRHS